MLRFLQAQGLAGSHSDVSGASSPVLQDEIERKNLLILIGTIIRSGDKKERQTLRIHLRKFGETGMEDATDTMPPNKEGNPPQRENSSSQERGPGHQQPQLSESAIIQRLSKYTRALNEYGDRVNISPKYDVHKETETPPWFKAVVSVNGSKRDGEARTKKHAMHLAAQKMCELLEIEAC